MRCPACAAELQPARSGALVIQRCAACRASWFGSGLLKACVDAMIRTGAVPDAPVEALRPVAAAAGLPETLRGCPACGAPLAKLNYGYDSNVLIDHCAACDGSWVSDEDVGRIAIYAKGNPALDRLSRAFVEESGKLEKEEEEAAFAVSALASPRAFAFCVPYRTTEPVARAPVALAVLLALNAAVYFLVEPSSKPAWAAFLQRWALIPAEAAAGRGLHGLLTALFLHASFLHLAGNLYFLWLFGRNVEDALGRARFLALYLTCGLAAGVVHVALNADSTLPMIGASGAISGVLGAFARAFPGAKVELWAGPGRARLLSARLYLGVWFGLQAWLWATTVLGVTTGVAFAAHVGGFLAGWFLAPVPAAAASPAA